MDEAAWRKRVALYVERSLYTTGTLAEIGFLIGDLTGDELRTAYITGSDLPILYDGQASHMIGQPGVTALHDAYLAEKPAH